MLSNYMELQNNIFNHYQAIFSKLIDDTSKSYWNNFIIGERQTGAYKMNDNKESDTTKDVTRTIDDYMLKYTDTLTNPQNSSKNIIMKVFKTTLTL